MIEEVAVKTTKRNQLVDITGSVEKAVKNSGVKEGLCVVFTPHTTAAITITENADPAVAVDVDEALSKLVPRDWGFRHEEGNSDGHVKSSLVGCSELLIISNSAPILGQWQSLFFCEFDGPRTRKVFVQVMGK